MSPTAVTVPTLSIVLMGVSAILSIGTPIFLFFHYQKRHGAKFLPLLTGALSFVLFALILEQMVHTAVLGPVSGLGILLRSRPGLFVLYAAGMAGLFEETARYLSFHLLKKRYSGIGTALSYGVGHGGIEAVLLSGTTMISNIALAVLLRSGAAPALMAKVPQETLAALAQTPSLLFLVSGLERLGAITVHIALSVVVYYAVARRGKWRLFPLAIFFHALVDVPPAMMQAGILRSVWLAEGLLFVTALALALFARALHRRMESRQQMSG